MNDDTPMPWGEHKGTPLKDVPDGYLLYLYEQPWIKEWKPLYAYLASRSADLAKARSTEREPLGEDGFTSFEDYKNYRGF